MKLRGDADGSGRKVLSCVLWSVVWTEAEKCARKLLVIQTIGHFSVLAGSLFVTACNSESVRTEFKKKKKSITFPAVNNFFFFFFCSNGAKAARDLCGARFPRARDDCRTLHPT